jgi:hypothetical protein
LQITHKCSVLTFKCNERRSRRASTDCRRTNHAYLITCLLRLPLRRPPLERIHCIYHRLPPLHHPTTLVVHHKLVERPQNEWLSKDPRLGSFRKISTLALVQKPLDICFRSQSTTDSLHCCHHKTSLHSSSFYLSTSTLLRLLIIVHVNPAIGRIFGPGLDLQSLMIHSTVLFNWVGIEDARP